MLEAVDERHRHWRDVTRREAYLADITYGQNSEFGFDYLRDNMVDDLARMVQRELNFAIVDEADSILIDEARTPLIISSPAEDVSEQYYRFADVAKKLRPERRLHPRGEAALRVADRGGHREDREAARRAATCTRATSPRCTSWTTR